MSEPPCVVHVYGPEGDPHYQLIYKGQFIGSTCGNEQQTAVFYEIADAVNSAAERLEPSE